MIFKGAAFLLKYLKLNKPQLARGCDQRVFTFDIETSNGFIFPESKQPQKFNYDLDPVDYKDATPVSICYLWQFGIDDVYFYGRDLRELVPVFDYLATRKWKTICWIHNLGWEFQFLLNILKYSKVFARRPHKPIYAEYDMLQFRCTYMLTRQKLESIGNNVGLPKLVEVMDYDAIYHPASHLPENVITYGIRDCEILTRYINKMVQRYELVQKIPLTQTGIPRKEVKDMYRDSWGYHKKMARLVPDFEKYDICRQCFVGGWVHANFLYVNQTIRPDGDGSGAAMGDITSSYPLQIVLRKYPVTPWSECSDPDQFDYYMNDDSFLELLLVEVTDLKSIGANDYLSQSKILRERGKEIAPEDRFTKNVKAENGRIYKADKITIWITSVDYDIMRRAYSGKFTIKRLLFSKAGYLDIRYVNYVLELYNNKVLLTGTGDPVKEELRSRSKELLNALYGMMVSALVYEDITFNPDTADWSTPKWKAPEELVAFYEDKLEELRTDFKKIAGLFTSYSYGVFVTAWARKSLFDAAQLITSDPTDPRRAGDRVIYHDTDSIYFDGDFRAVFDQINEQLHADLLTMAERRGIDPEKLHPRGQWIGDWKVETGDDTSADFVPFAEFRTLGAKRYAYRKKRPPEGFQWVMSKDEMIKITIAGVSKSKGSAALHDDIDTLQDHMQFSYKESGKLIPHYNSEQPDCIWIDEAGLSYKSDYRYGITLQPARYDYNISAFLEALVMRGQLSDQLAEMSNSQLQDLIN